MYDKYLTGNTFTTGTSRLPKHKGFIFDVTGVSYSGVTFHILNGQGNTLAMNIEFPTGSHFFPMSVYSVLALGSGMTGLYLN
jgi:hypothetical protein